MIRRDENSSWLLITQHDHAGLAGEIMECWGNESFSGPEPRDEVLFAIREHDSGWEEWDASPKIDPESGHPANFMEMGSAEHTEIWERSFRAPGSEHSYAATLIALHFAKFNQRTLDKDPSDKSALRLKEEIKQFIADKLGIELTDSLQAGVPADVKVNLKLLQIGDIMSLTLCHGWKSIEITEAPIDYSGNSATLKMESPDGFNYTVSHYPFNLLRLKFCIACRRLGRKVFSGDKEYRDMLSRAVREKLEFTISKD